MNPLHSATPSSRPADMPKRSAKPRIGFLRPVHVERAFVIMLYAAIFALVILSVLGTFYGWRGVAAPILNVRQIWRDVTTDTSMFGLAIGIQIVLSLAQYGARVMARYDPRWWILYLVALAISVYYNIQAYWTPLSALMPSYVVMPFLIALDAVPEFMAVRHD